MLQKFSFAIGILLVSLISRPALAVENKTLFRNDDQKVFKKIFEGTKNDLDKRYLNRGDFQKFDHTIEICKINPNLPQCTMQFR